ncbi:unnamed protein product [Calypogeia fissa]
MCKMEECGHNLLRRVSSLLLLLCVCSFPSIANASGLSSSKRRYCDNGYPFPPSEDQSFVEMLDNLLEEARSSLAKVEVSAKDSFGRFEGTAGCLWHNCQIYDSECYPCDSTRDSEACIETVISEVKLSILDSSTGYCVRTREFATGERSVAPNDASTTFQVCGIQYKFLGSVLSLGRRSGY